MTDEPKELSDDESSDSRPNHHKINEDKFKSAFDDDVDEFALVSAVWILACNDPYAIMTFGFIKERLQIKESLLKIIITDYKALFTDVPATWVEDWQHKLANDVFLYKYLSTDESDKQNFYDTYISLKFIQKDIVDKLKDRKNFKIQQLPSRIANKSRIEDKFNAIENISVKNTFMSQFRLSPIAEPSPIEILKWGLEYIEKHREIKKDIKEEKQKKWKEILIPALSLFIAVLSPLLTLLIIQHYNGENDERQKALNESQIKVQTENMNIQKQLKEKELEIQEKTFNLQRELKEENLTLKGKQ